MTVPMDDFIDPVIPEELIGTGPDDGLPHDFRGGCDSAGGYQLPNALNGTLRTSYTEFE